MNIKDQKMFKFHVTDSRKFIDSDCPYAIAVKEDNDSFILLETKVLTLKAAKSICKEASKMQGGYDLVWGWVVESVFNAGGYVAGDGYGSLVFMPLNAEECPKNMSSGMYELLLLAKRM